MNSRRWLHRCASCCCSASTREQIVEPFLADFERQWEDHARPPFRALLRAYCAFWQMMAICALRASLRWLVEAPSRFTFERIFVATYGVAIVLVIVYGFAWVRTGVLDATAGLIAIRKLIAMFGPGLLLAQSWRRAHRLRSRLLVLATFVAAIGAGYWLSGADGLGLALYNLLYLPIVWSPAIWAATRFHFKRPTSVK